MKPVFLTFAAVLCLLCVGCSDSDGADNSDSNPRKDIVLSRSQQEIVNSQARFAFNFFKAADKYFEPENVLVSPLSLSIDLAMIGNGAGERTYTLLTHAMQTPNTSIEDLNALYRKLMDGLLVADGKVELSIANSMWNHYEFDIKDGFAKRILNNYDATIETLDFKDSEKAKSTINQWASDNTKGKIANIFYEDEDLLSNDKFILCNALYFNGKWSEPFDKSETENRHFTDIEDSDNMVSTMVCRGKVQSYASTADAEVVKLPYGNGAFSMYVVLPALQEEIPYLQHLMTLFVDKFDYDMWISMKSQLKPTLMNLYMPKFRVETCMYDLGMAFFGDLVNVVNGADMSLMTDAYVNRIVISQFNSIEVSEDGTEAASVTKAEILEGCSPIQTTIDVNRPFIYLIEEESTGAILFMGKVTKLGQE